MSAEVAVVGLGPAGRALTHRLLARGVRVMAVDPHPDRPWAATYGGWRHQLPSWIDDTAVGATSGDTRLVARGNHVLAGEYLVLDNERLQRSLFLDGATVEARWVSDKELVCLAPRVVDCRGNRVGVPGGVAVSQTAFGIRLDPHQARPLLAGAEAVLMDWRPFDGTSHWGIRSPSFCYVVPLPDGRILAEETCLAGRPALSQHELASRLHHRLRVHGIEPPGQHDADVERVHIPMLPRPGARHGFGAAGREVNPISGYSVFSSLARADEVADCLANGQSWSSRTSAWRTQALESLLQLSPEAVVDLFDAFGRLSPGSQQAVLDPGTPDGPLLRGLTQQWMLMSGRNRLVGATARGLFQRGRS